MIADQRTQIRSGSWWRLIACGVRVAADDTYELTGGDHRDVAVGEPFDHIRRRSVLMRRADDEARPGRVASDDDPVPHLCIHCDAPHHRLEYSSMLWKRTARRGQTTRPGGTFAISAAVPWARDQSPAGRGPVALRGQMAAPHDE